jgi:branched-chain amino acid transport system ATP-binding protein
MMTKMTSNQEKAIEPQKSDHPMLTVRDLSVRYAKVEVLREIDIEVWQGEVVCLIGANGAGKTTLLRAISGLAPIVTGEIWFEHIDFRRLPPHQIAALGIAHVPQGRQIIPDLTVKGNLELGCYRFARRDRQRIRHLMEQEFARFPILGERRNQIASSLSGGEQQMLAISRALMMEPRFIMMDEPSLGLAPLVVEEIVKAIWHLHETGITILLVEQAATLALAISHRGYVLQNGRVFLKGTGQELLENPDIIKGYLGG